MPTALIIAPPQIFRPSYVLAAAWWYSELDVFVGTYQVSCKKLVSMAITTFLGL
jgi:hypothetical protein